MPDSQRGSRAGPDTESMVPAQLQDPVRGLVFPLGKGVLRLGRDRDNGLFLNEGQVSRHHAQVTSDGVRYLLKDLGSTNGTYVNGRRVTELELTDGDQILIGQARLVFRADDRRRGTRTSSVQLRESSSRIERPRVTMDPRGVAGQGLATREAVGTVMRFLEAVAGPLSPEPMQERALREAVAVFGAQRALYVSFDASGAPQVTAVRERVAPGPAAAGPAGSGTGLAGPAAVEVSRSVLDYVREQREAICVEDTAADPRLGPGDSIVRWQGCCIMSAPVVRADQLMGILYLDRPVAEGIYGEEDLRLLAILANLLAVGGENAGLYEQLLRASEFSEAILRCLGSGVVVVGRGGVVQRMNAYACELFRAREEEVRGEPLDRLAWLAPLAKILGEVADDGIPRDRSEVVLRGAPGGEDLVLGVTAHPLRGAHGDRIGAIANFRDLTGIRALEEEVRRTGRLAALGQMAAGIAHEVRNPLNSIRGFAELLQEQSKGQDGEYLGIIVREVDRINRIVQDLLDFARIDRIPADVFGLSEVVADLAAQLRPEAERDGIVVEPPALEPCVVRGSEGRMRQVLLNLVRNAIEAMQENPPGRPRVLSLAARRTEQSMTVVVRDTGPGIPDDVLPRIFDPFFTRKDRGTGLGLSICQKITEAHGGRLRVETRVGEGTTFTLELPLPDGPSLRSEPAAGVAPRAAAGA